MSTTGFVFGGSCLTAVMLKECFEISCTLFMWLMLHETNIINTYNWRICILINLAVQHNRASILREVYIL